MLLFATSHSLTPHVFDVLYCFRAQKRLAKQQAKEAEKAAKAEAKAASKPAASSASASSDKKKVSAGEEEEEVDPTHYFDQRVRELTEMKAAGKHKHLYPHKFHAALSLPHFQYEYKQLDILNGQRLDREVSVAGRVYNKRSSGASLYFYDLQGQGERVQIVADRKSEQHACKPVCARPLLCSARSPHFTTYQPSTALVRCLACVLMSGVTRTTSLSTSTSSEVCSATHTHTHTHTTYTLHCAA